MTMEQEPDYDQFSETDDITSEIALELEKDKKLSVFALLDSTGDTGLFADLRSYDPDAEYELIFDSIVDHEPSPFIAKLKPDSAFLKYMIDREFEHEVNLTTLYVSDIDLDIQIAHWKQSLFIQNEIGETILFRYFDPRVLTGYLSVSTQKEQSLLMGPMKQFWVPDEGEWLGLENPDNDYASNFKEKKEEEINISSPPLVLRKEHKQEADRLYEINLASVILDFIRNEEPKLTDPYTTEELEPIILSAIYRAKKYGITDEVSLRHWSMLMFDVSPCFDEQPNINASLKDESIHANKRLMHSIDITSDDDWEEASMLYSVESMDPEFNMEEL